jgi:uncharacterized protein YecE (DUF72 family)
MGIHIGTSGWHYRHWLGTLYPQGTPTNRWFSLYSRFFATVELNNPFYRLPSSETFSTWAQQAPPGFLYAVKASRYITHNKKLKDAGEALSLFLGNVRHLGHTLGPVLFQLPPHWGFNGDRLEEFLSILPRPKAMRPSPFVFEFRNPAWMREETYALLEKYRAAFCIHDMQGSRTPMRTTSDLVYVRFHGTIGKYGGSYPDDTLSGWADRIEAWAKTGKRVFCFFNNDGGGWAHRNAATLIGYLSRKTWTPSHFSIFSQAPPVSLSQASQ